MRKRRITLHPIQASRLRDRCVARGQRVVAEALEPDAMGYLVITSTSRLRVDVDIADFEEPHRFINRVRARIGLPPIS